MMSNGPVTSLRSFHGRSRTISAASIWSSPRRTWTRRKPSLRSRPSDRFEVAVLAGDHVVAEVAVRARLVALDRDGLRDVQHDGVDQHVVAPWPA